MYYVYVLEQANHQLYVGSSPDLKRRISQHIQGKAKSTRYLRPVRLVWYSGFTTRLLARRFEAYLKTGSGKAFLGKRLIEKR